MNDLRPAITLDHPDVIVACERYAELLEAGERPSQADVLARFPGIAEQLRDCLEGMDMLHGSRSQAQSMRRLAADDGLNLLQDFRLIRELGRGGMGIVYEAEQLSLHRRVALKVLPAVAIFDDRKVRRFQHEARAAACLDHPHIVPVYAVGEAEGVHYYVMKFIRGATLADCIAARRGCSRQSQIDTSRGAVDQSASTHITPGEDAASSHRLPIPTAGSEDVNIAAAASVAVLESLAVESKDYCRQVALFGQQAAEALDHAHRLGVVHRDVKPANLLLDEDGHLWVADFGLAHLEGGADLTTTGDLIGTLRYMSPEQALGNRSVVDHRADVYSLGATLYEMLTLSPTVSADSHTEAIEQITAREPERPRKLNRAIPVDLETILLTALAKDASDRYATAKDLADDLNSFLNDRPIAARRPSWTERAARWTRRHRRVALTAVVLLLLTSLGLGLSTYSIWWEKAQAEAAYQREARQRQLAEDRFLQARQMLEYFTQMVEQDLSDAGDVQAVRKELLSASLVYYEDFIEQAEPDPRLQKELSDSHFRIAAILEQIGDQQSATASFSEALDLHEELVRAHPNDRGLREGLEHKYQWWAFFRSGEVVRQMQRDTVRDELQLTPEQRENMKQIYAEYYRFDSTAWKRGPGERLRRIEGKQSTASSEIHQLLTPAQLMRLEQICLQARGAEAFGDPAVQASLDLSTEQVRQVAELSQQHTPVRHGPHWLGGPRRKADDETSKLPDVLAILNPQQQAAWEKLIGEPFPVDTVEQAKPRFPSFGRPPGPPKRRRRGGGKPI